jgi:hypothetical protein
MSNVVNFRGRSTPRLNTNVGRGGGRGGGRTPRSARPVSVSDHHSHFDYTVADGRGSIVDLLSDFPFAKVKNVRSIKISAVVSPRVVLGEKYVASVAIGLRLSSVIPENVTSVTDLPSHTVLSLPCNGQLTKNLKAPDKSVCDLTSASSKLYVVIWADTDRAADFTGPLGTIRFNLDVSYEPKDGDVSAWQ